MVVLVTGASGQLGQAIKSVALNYPDIDFRFTDSAELDITNAENIDSVFAKINPSFCINAAAYTAVDKAESEHEKAYAINVHGALNLAQAAKKYDTILIHISTDFVFDGKAIRQYSEDDAPNPMSVYGKTKLEGEYAITATWHKHIIIRTSWLYSIFGNNFMKTMLRLASQSDSLSVVDDQIGTPTNAVDLAEAIIKIIKELDFNSTHKYGALNDQPYGIYHFSNEGECSWYGFASKIMELSKIGIIVQAIPTSSFPTAAKRPAYSVLDKSKIKNVFNINLKTWESSLAEILLK